MQRKISDVVILKRRISLTKPEWLKEVERKKNSIAQEPNKCIDCLYFGRYVKDTKHRGKDRCAVHECDIHPGCFNTEFSICCSDWTKA